MISLDQAQNRELKKIIDMLYEIEDEDLYVIAVNRDHKVRKSFPYEKAREIARSLASKYFPEGGSKRRFAEELILKFLYRVWRNLSFDAGYNMSMWWTYTTFVEVGAFVMGITDIKDSKVIDIITDEILKYADTKAEEIAKKLGIRSVGALVWGRLLGLI